MNICNICLQSNLNQIYWHRPHKITHAAHLSCQKCVASELFYRLQNHQNITCPICREICQINKKNESSYELILSTLSTVTLLMSRYVFSDMGAFLFSNLETTLVSFDTCQWINLSPTISFYGFQDFHSQKVNHSMHQHLVNQKQPEIIAYIADYTAKKDLTALCLYSLSSLAILYTMLKNHTFKANLKGMLQLSIHVSLNMTILNYFKMSYKDYLICNDLSCDLSTPPYLNPSKANKNFLELFSIAAVALVVFYIKMEEFTSNKEKLDLNHATQEEILNLIQKKKIVLEGTKRFEF